MKKFFKVVFATMLGFILLKLISFLLLLVLIIGLAGNTQETTTISPNSILELDLDGTIEERVAESPFDSYLPQAAQLNSVGLDVILKNIKKAKTDDNIKGINLKVSSMVTSYGTVEEIRNALLDFKESGKFIYTYSETMTQGAYYLASCSDKLFFNPEGLLDVRGLSMQVMFYKRLLDKLEIEAQIVKVGTYKSAVEPFVLESMSPANRQQVATFLSSMWGNITEQICKSRNITADVLNDFCDKMTGYGNLETAKQFKIIDSLAYSDQYWDFVRTKMGVEKESDLNIISLSKYNKVKAAKTNDAKDKIAVVYASGEIIDDEGDNSTIGRNIAEAIAEASAEKNVKAIVLRINSGGGSALMSEVIWREVIRAKEKKPVVVSMGDVAASGGYYIACPANYIVAEPNSLTGSIGVFGVIPNAKKFLNDKIGLTVDVVNTNQHSDGIGLMRPMDDFERGVMQNYVNKTYSTFIGHVAQGRNKTTAYVDSIGQGRVWSGIDALKIGLVDTLGGIDVAIYKAVQLSGTKDYRCVDFPVLETFYQEMFKKMSEEQLSSYLTKTKLAQTYKYFSQIENVINMEGVQARIPFQYEIK